MTKQSVINLNGDHEVLIERFDDAIKLAEAEDVAS